MVMNGRLIFGDEHTGVDTEIQGGAHETNIVLINQMSPQLKINYKNSLA